MPFVLVFIIVSISTSAFSEGDVHSGKNLFNDPKLGGSTNELSCNSCHPDGKGLSDAVKKNELRTKAGDGELLEKIVNQCITNALKGHALETKSGEMQDIVAYIKSLK